MHRHHVTLRLLIKLVAVVLIGMAVYLIIKYGIGHPVFTACSALSTVVG